MIVFDSNLIASQMCAVVNCQLINESFARVEDIGRVLVSGGKVVTGDFA
jgi:hypothetical protein